MDFIEYYNDLDIHKVIEEQENLNDLGITARIFCDGSKNKWSHQQFYFQKESDRIVKYAIEDLKKNTMYLSNPALLEYIKEIKSQKIENHIPLKNQFTKQAFIEANVKFKDFLEQLEKTLMKPEPEKLPTLKAIFQDQNDLDKLVELLKKKGFVKEVADRLYWTGKPVEFAAMCRICLPLIIEDFKESKILHHAWTSKFFKKDKEPKPILSETYFKKAKLIKIYHLDKFDFLKEKFDIK